MQTFLPYSDFQKSAACLDNSRLGNQCYRECKTLLTGGWKHHPVSKMWNNHKGALCLYALALVDEMEKRSKWKPEVIDRWRDYYTQQLEGRNTKMPPWLGNTEFHSAHRAALLYKDYEHYSQFGWTEKPELNYIWPCQYYGT